MRRARHCLAPWWEPSPPWGVVLTSLVAWRNERSRQQAAKDAADVEILRQHTAVAFTEMFAINHAPTGSHGSPSTPRAR
jgi:hypothetical protein